jgi:A/G-specific adenine glycosylase
MTARIAKKLLAWYHRHARRLPWRDDPAPYRVWVSEIMLQQTRVEAVIPYFVRWMAQFPTIASLAAASQQDVLQAWEGLGYYSRARNLHWAAQIVTAEYSGELPDERRALESLPGIGPYTAGAIASIAFGQDEAALDGNIRRVYARLFNIDLPLRSNEAEKLLWDIARQQLPAGQAGDYNQALMDLGATVCTPRNPNCMECPLQQLCEAHALGLQEMRPVKNARPAVPRYTVAAAVIERDGQVLIAKRPSSGLLGGMWEFPGGKREDDESLPQALQREIQEELGTQIRVGEELGVYDHAYTHFKVTLHAFHCRLTGGEPQALEASELCWVAVSSLSDYPMGKIDRMISRDLQNR